MNYWSRTQSSVATCAFSLYDDHRANKCQKDSKRQTFVFDICSRLGSLEDVDESLQRHRSLFSNGFPLYLANTKIGLMWMISQTPRLVWCEWQRNPGTPWRETHTKNKTKKKTKQKNTHKKKKKKHTHTHTHTHKAYLNDTSSVYNKTAYSNICKTVQTRLRDVQDSSLSKKADEIQSFADRKDMKEFFDAL